MIPCCVDLCEFPLQIKTKNRFTLGYLGSIGSWYMLDEMLDFYIELKKQKHDAIFHFLTKDDPNLILNCVKRKKINLNDIKIEPAERQDIKKLTSTWDYSIFFIKPAYSKISSSPTKQAELMAMGIPIICNAGIGDTDSIVEKYKSGYLVKEFRNSEYKKVISKIIYKNEIFSPMKLRNGAMDYFNLEHGVAIYYSIYKETSA